MQVNNAGCMINERKMNADGLEMNFLTNTLGKTIFSDTCLDIKRTECYSYPYQRPPHSTDRNPFVTWRTKPRQRPYQFNTHSASNLIKEFTMFVNITGVYILTIGLLPLIEKSKEPRIVSTGVWGLGANE
jgi:hypothetical protein